MSSSVYVDNKKKDILILGIGPTQGLDGTTLTVEKKQLCLSLHYNGSSSYLFVNGTKTIAFKAKDFEIIATPLRIGNISKDVSVNNMKKTELNGYVYDFSVDYDAISVDDILDIHKY